MKRITLLSTSLILLSVLTACNSTVKPECWKATHNTVGKDCNSGGGGFTMNSPRTGNKKKTSVSTDVNTDVSTSTPDVPTPSPDTDEDTSTTPEDNTNPNPPNQSNSNDIEGYDPFGGLYGPGT